MSNTTHETFTEAFNLINDVVEYNDAFNNGTGYFDGLVSHNTELEVGTRFKMQTPMPNNRKIVAIVTPVGNVVFFERYTDGKDGIITKNVPNSLANLWNCNVVTEEVLFAAIGCPEGYNANIGHTLQRVIDAAARKAVEGDVDQI